MGRRNVVLFALLGIFGVANALYLRREEDGSRGSHHNELQYHRELQGSALVDVSLSTAESDFRDFPGSSGAGPVASLTTSNVDGHDLAIETGGPFVGPEILLEPQLGSKNRDVVALEPTKRIIGGYDAEPHPFHSMLLLRYGGSWRWAGCGATLVSNCHVVTAAHCAADPTKPLGAVFVNAHRPYQENGDVPFHFSEVQHVIRHAGFNATTNENDIAVIKMALCISNTTQFPPAIPASPTMDIPSAFVADILGFGKLSEQGNIFVNVQALQKAQVPIIPQNTCQEFYGEKIKDDMFCAGFAEGGADACQGDSGSSMTFEDEKSAVLIGIISWGVGCGRSHSPGVYASVKHHYSWLARQVCGEADTDASWCSTLYIHPPTLSPSAAASDEATALPPPPTSGSSSKRSHKGRTSSGFYSSSLSTMIVAQSRMEAAPSAVEAHKNIDGSTEQQDNHVLQFWDRTWRHSRDCKLPGNQCWLGNECCSGVCRQHTRSDYPSQSHAECLTLNPTDEIKQRRKGTRGVRVRRGEN